jgi:N-acetylglutamate synthase-like GNAT family acetyltransferase
MAGAVTETSSKRREADMSPGETTGMLSTVSIRPAVAADLPAICDLIAQLGYAIRQDTLGDLLQTMLRDRRHAVLVAEAADQGIVAMVALSSRPVLRLQGWIGTIEELVVKRGLRDRGTGDRLIQYAKGLAAERGWVRLEAVVARRRESNRRSFLYSRGFVSAECVTYRWGRLEGQHRASWGLYPEHRYPEMV